MIGHIFINDDGQRAPRRTRILRVAVLNVLFAFVPFLAVIEVTKAADRSQWVATPCTIVSSGVDRDDAGGLNSDAPYVAAITWQFYFNAEIADGRMENERSSDAGKMNEMVRPYPRGTKAICYVDPWNIQKSALARPSVLYPALFLIGSIITFVLAWIFYCIPQLRESPPVKFISPEARQRRNWWAGVALMAGLFAWTTWMFFAPLIRNVQASRWPKVPCEVLSRNVLRKEIHGEGYMVLYHVDVLYKYVVNGVEYLSNQYSATDTGAPFYSAGKIELSRRALLDIPPTCRVNPLDPTDAVITTAIAPSFAFGLIPLSFLLLLGVMMYRKRSIASSRWFDPRNARAALQRKGR